MFPELKFEGRPLQHQVADILDQIEGIDERLHKAIIAICCSMDELELSKQEAKGKLEGFIEELATDGEVAKSDSVNMIGEIAVHLIASMKISTRGLSLATELGIEVLTSKLRSLF